MKKIVDGYELDLNIREDSHSDGLVVKEIFDENVYHIHDNMIENNDVIIDLGANIGMFTLDIARRSKKNNVQTTIYSIEPEKNNLQYLKSNILLNKNLLSNSEILIIDKAIGDFNGKSQISDNHGGSRIGDVGDEINVITFDKFVKDELIGDIKILKIDIEGFETNVLLGNDPSNLFKCKFIIVEFDEQSDLDDFASIIRIFGERYSFYTLGVPSRGCYLYMERHI